MIFFEDDTSFSFNSTSFQSKEQLNKGLWLILIGVNDIPHIALLHEGDYYSLSTRKVDCGSSLERLLNVLERKNVPTLFIQIEEDNIIARNEATSVLLLKTYKDLKPLGITKNTCLSPIKEFFTKYYSEDFAHVNYVFELLALAEKKNLLKECITVNILSNKITLPKYTMAQIRDTITKLSTPVTTINNE